MCSNTNKTIAIDGTSGVGKSSLSKLLSSHYEVPNLNSGAMFRMLAYRTMELFPEKPHTAFSTEDLTFVLNKSSFVLQYSNGTSILLYNEAPIPEDIYTEAIAKATAHIASFPIVRETLRNFQRALAKETSLIAEGRDMGTVVFPEADAKIFLTACAKKRARRRYEELCALCPDVLYEEVLQQIKERDKKDTIRAESPLIPSETAYIVDTTEYSLKEVLCIVREHIDSKQIFS